MTTPSYLQVINERTEVVALEEAVNEARRAIDAHLRSRRVSFKDTVGKQVWKVRQTSSSLTVVYMNGKFAYVEVYRDYDETFLDADSLPSMDAAIELGLIPRKLLGAHKTALAAHAAKAEATHKEDKLRALVHEMGKEAVAKFLADSV